MDDILKVDEVAKILKVDPEVIRRWLRSGKLPGVKLAGDEWRVRHSDLDIFVAPTNQTGG